MNETGSVPLVLDLFIVHERFGSTSDPGLNGHLHYPSDIDRSLNETVPDKIRKYHDDYYYDSPNVISFRPDITSTSGRLRLCARSGPSSNPANKQILILWWVGDAPDQDFFIFFKFFFKKIKKHFFPCSTICMIHGLVLTTHLEDEFVSSCSCT